MLRSKIVRNEEGELAHQTSRPVKVSLSEVSKVFKDRTVLNRVSLDIEPSSFTVLLGPSGSGKSTLLRIIAGIERLSEGTVELDNSTVSAKYFHIPPNKRSLAMVFQDYALWPHMTALENVKFALKRLDMSSSKASVRSKEALDKVGLGPLGQCYPNELSGGEQQRVALARALVARMGLVLFDEPLSNLDADLRENLRLEISTLVRETKSTVIYITHDQSEAFALADKIGILQNGKVVQFDSPENIYMNPINAEVARFTGVSGEIPVDFVGSMIENKYVGVSLKAGKSSKIIAARVPQEEYPRDKMKLFVRSKGAKLVEPTNIASIVGCIKDCWYSGHGYEHAVSLSDGTVLTKIFSEDKYSRGSSVGVQLDPDLSLLFPVEKCTDAKESKIEPEELLSKMRQIEQVAT